MASIASPSWGNVPYEITQGFGVGFRADWYQYSANYGVPAGWHIAYDIGMPKGTMLYAMSSGIVVHAGWLDSYRPNPVIIDTDDGYRETWGHMWTNNVRTGQRVTPGTLLGTSGEQTIKGTMTPDGSGPHLHFELYRVDQSLPSGFRAIDPGNYIRARAAGVHPNPPVNPGSGSGGLPNTGSSPGIPGAAIDAGQWIVDKLFGAPGELAGAATGLIADYARRGFLVIVGTGLLIVGVIAITRNDANPARATERATRSTKRRITSAAKVATAPTPVGKIRAAARVVA